MAADGEREGPFKRAAELEGSIISNRRSKMHSFLKLGLCGAMVLGCSRIVSASAITLTTADGSGADSFVSNDGNQSATSVHGGDGSLAIPNYDTVRAKATYFRFDLSDVTGDLS